MYFKDVIGQEQIKGRLLQSVKENRVSHARLFLSKEGTGGLPLAIAYSRYLLCKDKLDKDSCGKCSSCVKFDKLTHPDLHFSFPVVLSQAKTADGKIKEFRNAVSETPYMSLHHWLSLGGDENKKGVIGKDESQQIIKKLTLKSFEGDYKILIIWMAENMNTSAANKLLKIIEEPPAKTLFLLIAESHESILPTILSRTQMMSLSAVEDELIIEELKRSSVPEADALSIAGLTEGNYWMAQQLASNSEHQQFNFEQFVNWMRLAYKKDVANLIDWSEEISSIGRERLKNYLKYSLHLIRQSMLGNYGDANLVKLHGHELNFIQKFAPFINGRNLLDLMEQINEAYFHIDRNGNAKIIMLDLSFSILKLLRK